MLKVIPKLNKNYMNFITANVKLLQNKLLSIDSFNKYINEQLKGYIQSENSNIIHIESGNNNIYLHIIKLNAASNLLSLEICDINWIAYNNAVFLSDTMPSIIDYLKNQLHTDMLIYKAPNEPSLHSILQQNNFEDYGENHTFHIEAPPVIGIPLPSEITFIPGRNGLEKPISEIVLKTYKHGHYFSDPRINPRKAQQLMTEGILNLYQNNPRNFAFFYNKDKLLGFSCLEILDKINKYLPLPLAQMQFTVFDMDWNEKIFFPAIYSKKLEYFMSFHKGQFLAEIFQDNRTAIKLVPQNATQIINRTRIFHLWL